MNATDKHALGERFSFLQLAHSIFHLTYARHTMDILEKTGKLGTPPNSGPLSAKSVLFCYFSRFHTPIEEITSKSSSSGIPGNSGDTI